VIHGHSVLYGYCYYCMILALFGMSGLCEYAIVAYFQKVCISHIFTAWTVTFDSFNILWKFKIFFVPLSWPNSTYYRHIFRLVTVCIFLARNCCIVTL